MIFGLSFGKSKTSSSGSEDSKTNITKDSTATQSKSGTSSTTGSSAQTVSQLDEETQNVLRNLIQQAGGNAEATDLTDFANSLIQRGQATEKALGDNISAIINEARLSGERELQALNTQLATAAGSTQNTFVAGATAQGRADLESKLAAREAELGIAAREAGSRDLLNAFGALSTGAGQETSNIVNLVNALKGGTTASTGTSAQTTLTDEELKSVEQISQVIDSLIKTTGVSSGKQTGISLNF